MSFIRSIAGMPAIIASVWCADRVATVGVKVPEVQFMAVQSVLSSIIGFSFTFLAMIPAVF